MQRSSKQEEPQPALAPWILSKNWTQILAFLQLGYHCGGRNFITQWISLSKNSMVVVTAAFTRLKFSTLFRKGRMVGGCSFEETFRYGNGKQHQVLLNENLCHDPEVHGFKGLLQSTPNHKHSASCNEQNTAPSPTVGLCGSMLICVGRHVFPLASSGGSPLERCIVSISIKDIGPTLDSCGITGVVEKLFRSCWVIWYQAARELFLTIPLKYQCEAPAIGPCGSDGAKACKFCTQCVVNSWFSLDICCSEVLFGNRCSKYSVYIYIYTVSDWWFGTFFIFSYIGNNYPNWLIFNRQSIALIHTHDT